MTPEARDERRNRALDALRALQKTSVDDVRALERRIRAEVHERKKSTGDIDPFMPLYAELTATAIRGPIVPLTSPIGIEFGLSVDGRMRTFGDDVLFDDRPDAIDRIQLKRSGRVGAVSRYLRDEAGRVDEIVTLSSDGRTASGWSYDLDGDRVVAVRSWSSRSPLVTEYAVAYSAEGLVERIEAVGSSRPLYVRPTEALPVLLARLEPTFRRAAATAVADASREAEVISVILMLSGPRFGLVPPQLFVGAVRPEASGPRDLSVLEGLWNPRMEQLLEVDVALDPNQTRSCAEIRGYLLDADAIAFVEETFDTWAKSWRSEFRATLQVSDVFVVIPLAPEYSSAASAIRRVGTDDDVRRLLERKLLPTY